MRSVEIPEGLCAFVYRNPYGEPVSLEDSKRGGALIVPSGETVAWASSSNDLADLMNVTISAMVGERR